MSIRRVLILSTLVLAALTACASPDHVDADVAFVQQMIPHHQQAVAMAEMAPGRAADPEVLRLATAIRDAQGPEIARMTGYLREWGVAPAAGMTDMPGMMDPAAMDRLNASSGVAFERAWVSDMIAHHDGAVRMADEELAQGVDPDVRALAQGIRDSQTREIAQMTALRGRLG